MHEEVLPGIRFASEAHELWALLGHIAGEFYERRFAAAAQATGLSPAVAVALLKVEPGTAISQKELARRLRCSPSTVVDSADKLEAVGLVERRPHPSDRRVNALVLTERGRRTRARLVARAFQPPDCLNRLAAADRVRLRATLLELAETLSAE